MQSHGSTLDLLAQSVMATRAGSPKVDSGGFLVVPGDAGPPPGIPSDNALGGERIEIGRYDRYDREVFYVTMNKLPDKALLHIFSYLHHKEMLKCAQVCKKWRTIAYDPRLWQVVSLRPEYGGLHVNSVDALIALISVRMGPQLRLMELPTDLINYPVLHELANKCPKLQYLTLDFSSAMQLHDFNDLQSFPARLKCLIICLSEVIFLEGFVKKIYSFIGCLEILHIIGTYEKVESEEEVYEVINISKLKAHTPNLRVINLWGTAFITDDHIESISSSCAHLECLMVNYCVKVKGTALKPLLARCKKLKCLGLEQCPLESRAMIAAEWEKSQIQELNITATELSTEAIVSVLTRLTKLRLLIAGYLEHFTDQAMEMWLDSGACNELIGVDLHYCDSLSEAVLADFIVRQGEYLQGFIVGGHPRLLETFWMTHIPMLKKIKYLVFGVPETCCAKVQAKITIDQLMDCLSNNCPELRALEVRWDPNTLRFSEKSAKFINVLRMKCYKMRWLVLTDGEYFEMVRSNFERVGQMTVVRATNYCRVTLVPLFQFYKELIFN